MKQRSFPFLLFTFLFLTCSYLYGQETEPVKLKLLFAGDLMGHDGQIRSALDEISGTYSYDTCFSIIKDLTREADLSILNLEVTLAGEPYKGYPQFSSPDAVAVAAKNAGFDVFLTANNHSLDRGKKGLERTLDVLDQNEIIHTGTFRDSLERVENFPLLIEKNGIRLALLNYTYGTNGLLVSKPNIVNYIDTIQIKKDLIKAREANPDFIIATLHWGLEYQRTENKQQTVLAEFLLDHGTDAIIGSHPHVIQPIRKYHRNPSDSSHFNLVVYSLGNFISNQGERFRDGGIMVEIEITKNADTRVTSVKTHPVFVYKPLKAGGGEYFVLIPTRKMDEMVDLFQMPEGDQLYFKTFAEDTYDHLGE